MTDVAIVGGSDETRLLLRGLVRLHHHRVVYEGPNPASLAEMPAEPPTLAVLIDADIESTEWSGPIEAALRSRPAARAVLIAPTRSPRVIERAKGLGFATVLRRPFAVHELVEVLTVAGVPPTPSGTIEPTP
jgi:hypothetical protein